MLEFINQEVVLRMFSYGQQFRNNLPFPHIKIDDFLREDIARRLLQEFPRFDPVKATNELGLVGGKAVHTNIRELGGLYTEMDDLIQSGEFLKLMSGLTGIPELLYDPEYVGGGTHENLEGQELDPHVDFNYHPQRKWHRRLNLLLYLNEEWNDSWGGCIELHSNPWDPDHNRVNAFTPLMNRCVIFETSEKSWHGFKTIRLPDNKKHVSRKSIALYFYSLKRPAGEIFPEHGTFYVHRPLPDRIRAGHTLTEADIEELKVLLIRRDSWIQFLYERELGFSATMGDLHSQIARLQTDGSQSFWKRLISKK